MTEVTEATAEPDGPPADEQSAPAEDAASDGTAVEATDTAGGGAPEQEHESVTEQSIPSEQLPAIIEALLFVSDGPVDLTLLIRTLDVPRKAAREALDTLGELLRDQQRGIRLQRGPDGAQLVTAVEAADPVERLLGLEGSRRLSTAALETLAIVAYRQPVTRALMESIRGVNCDAAIATLRARGLISIVGRAPGPGRPALFASTQRFLEHFGLEGPEDLPALPELEGDETRQGAMALNTTDEAGEAEERDEHGEPDDLERLSAAAAATLGRENAVAEVAAELAEEAGAPAADAPDEAIEEGDRSDAPDDSDTPDASGGDGEPPDS